MVYLAGLETGLTPRSRVVDGPVDIDGWTPRNFNGRYVGEMSLADALAGSVNTVAVQVAERAGAKRVVATARRLGITQPLVADLSLALGTGEVSLIDLVTAYVPFANGGYGVWAHGIEAIHDGSGREVYRRRGSGSGRVVDAAHVGAMNAMLRQVVLAGTGKAAAIPRPVAGKTGTSQDYRDAWFVGYSADLVAGVWLGNDDSRPMKKVTGGGLPAQAWRDFMAAAHGDMPERLLPGLEPAVMADNGKSFWRSFLDTLLEDRG